MDWMQKLTGYKVSGNISAKDRKVSVQHGMLTFYIYSKEKLYRNNEMEEGESLNYKKAGSVDLKFDASCFYFVIQTYDEILAWDIAGTMLH